MKKIFVTLVFTLIFATAAQAKDLEKIWEQTGFSMPESVVINPKDNSIYVSNVNADKNGYISKLAADGEIVNLQWITGLNNPAGLSIYEGILYIGDGSSVHLIDIEKGKLLKSISSNEAQALNDVAIDENGLVFISDIATGKIFTIKDGSLDVWFSGPNLKHSNGLFIRGNYIYVADFGTILSHDITPEQYGSLYKISLLDKTYGRVASTTHLGGLDGIAKIDNALLVGSNTTGELFAITDKERVLVATFDIGLADITMVDGILYTPLIFSNKVTAYRLTRPGTTPPTIQ